MFIETFFFFFLLWLWKLREKMQFQNVSSNPKKTINCLICPTSLWRFQESLFFFFAICCLLFNHSFESGLLSWKGRKAKWIMRLVLYGNLPYISQHIAICNIHRLMIWFRLNMTCYLSTKINIITFSKL